MNYQILIVDDRPENLLALEAVLEPLTCKIIKANSGTEALEKLIKHNIALIILDVMMPEMDGFETAKLIRGRKQTMKIPIIFVTANKDDQQYLFKAYESGGIDFLTKPIDPYLLKQKAKVFLKLFDYESQLESKLSELQKKNQEMARLNKQVNDYASRLEIKTIEAENANKAKSIFLANISHEIRTPMNAILGFTDILYQDEFDPIKKKKLEIIKQSGNFLLNLINDLLDLSKIEAGKIEIIKSEFSLFELFEEMHYLFVETANKQQLAFNIEVTPAVPEYVYGDERYLKQIIMNLLSNAFKFTMQGGVEIHCDYYGENAVIKVKDTGIGIKKEEQDSIFDVFKQTSNAVKGKFKGTGLGLALSRKFVEMLGGEISVTSEIGEGSTFSINMPLPVVDKNRVVYKADQNLQAQNVRMMVQTWLSNFNGEPLLQKVLLNAIKTMPARLITLEESINTGRLKEIEFQAHTIKGFSGSVKMVEISDLARKMEQEIQKNNFNIKRIENYFLQMKSIVDNIPVEYKDSTIKTEDLQKSSSQLKILVAEDNDLNLEIIKAFLYRMGFSCDEADNGLTVLRKLEKQHYDILLLDISMPVMDGLETIAKIREQPAFDKLKVIALTAYSMKGDREKFLAAGFDDYISKPIDRSKLWEKLWK